jgi:hypothetical protein
MKPSILFLEGPAYAGKTTFLGTLDSQQYKLLPEASEFVHGDKFFPAAPTDVKSMVYCSIFFAVMERMRLSALEANKINVADRFTPLSSMIFYYLRYKAGHISASDYYLGTHLSSQVFLDDLQLPSDIQSQFLLFTISDEAVFRQRMTRGTRNTDFDSWQNFELLSLYYKQLLSRDTNLVIDNKFTMNELPTDKWLDQRTLLDLLNPDNFIPDEAEFEHLRKEGIHAGPTDYVDSSEHMAIEKLVEELVHG